MERELWREWERDGRRNSSELLIIERASYYSSTGEYPPNTSKNDKRTIRRKASKLCVEGGDVFYLQRGGKKVHKISYSKPSSPSLFNLALQLFFFFFFFKD